MTVPLDHFDQPNEFESVILSPPSATTLPFTPSSIDTCTNPNLILNILQRIESNRSILDFLVSQSLPIKFIHIPKTGGTTIEYVGKKFGFRWGKYDTKMIDKLHKYGKFGGRQLFHCPEWHIPPYLTYKFDDNSVMKPNLYQNEDTFDIFNTFCVVRNPYERIISEWNFMNKCNGDINQWIKHSIDLLKTKFTHQAGHWIPQYKYVYEMWNINDNDIDTLNEAKIFNISNDWINHHVTHMKNIQKNNIENDLLNVNINSSCKFILKQENLNDDFQSLMRLFDEQTSLISNGLTMYKFFHQLKPIVAATKHGTQLIEQCKKNQRKNGLKLTKTSIQLIQNAYKRDFDLFCYDINQLPSYVKIIDD